MRQRREAEARAAECSAEGRTAGDGRAPSAGFPGARMGGIGVEEAGLVTLLA